MGTSPTESAGTVIPTPFAGALRERYLGYALSTIMARSLPDVRDGLKPVHRRLLYAMRELRLDPSQGFKKSARVIGDVIGKFHPHGDTSVYDAMVRLAQDFSVRYPLVDGQGNFGNIDGDNPAAMRYTEARLTEAAAALLADIDAGTVDFRGTYDEEGREPVVLPAAFPNLLANGAAGIAVGMATSIPPHNVGEICAALRHLLRHPEAPTTDLLAHMPGPDFPTGGVLVETPAAVAAAYERGRGAFRLRARWRTETLPRGQYRIVVYEIPYQVQKSRLIERIAAGLHERKLPLLGDIRDESAEDVRLVLEPRSRNIDPALLMESLFRASELESRFSLNMNVLDAGRVPGVMPLRAVLQAFLDHRMTVMIRRSRYRLERIDQRLATLRGYEIVYLNLDEVIRIVREEEDARAALMARWDLDDAQADAILAMRLRALRRLEEVAIRKEMAALTTERAGLEALLGDEKRRRTALGREIAAIGKRFADPRRTEIGQPPDTATLPAAAMLEREPVTIVCSGKGWIRSVRGHGQPAADMRYKEGDGPRFALDAHTTDKLLVLTTGGRFHTLPADRVPGGRGHGEALRLLCEMSSEEAPIALFAHQPGRKRLLAADDGRGFIVNEDDVVARTRAGRQVLNVAAGARATCCVPVAGDHVAVLGTNRKLLVFPLAGVPEMSRGRGVILQRYRDRQAGLADVTTFRLADGLPTRPGGRRRTFTATELQTCLGKRATTGQPPPTGFPRTGGFGTDPAS